MKTIYFQDREEWLEAREKKITGSKLKDILSLKSSKPKKGFWQLIADRVALKEDGENAMDRGLRLENKAIERFEKETKKKVDTSLVMWTSDENENIAVSPDGFIGTKEAVEVKCLNSASHIEAFITQEIPNEYEFQVLQYFIVNKKLKTLYFVFYDDRVPTNDFFFIKINRSDKELEIEKYLQEELNILKEVERISLLLTKF